MEFFKSILLQSVAQFVDEALFVVRKFSGRPIRGFFFGGSSFAKTLGIRRPSRKLV